MVSLASKLAIVGVVFIAILYQFIFKTLVFDVFGLGRKVDSIKDYSHVRCEKTDKLGLEGCEDMWLHEKTGYLYMACSNTNSRQEWIPALVFHISTSEFQQLTKCSLDHLNAYGRERKDRVAVVDTRKPGPLSSRIQWLTVENFPGINGDSSLDLHGLDIRPDEHTDTLRILLVNHRPPINPVTGELLDATSIGANSTIEQFQTKAGSSTMRYVRTYAHKAIQTPNRVAWVNDHAFVFTNDHSGKVGLVRKVPYHANFIITDKPSVALWIHYLVEAQSATAIEIAATLPTQKASTSPMVSSKVRMVSYMFPTLSRQRSTSCLSLKTISWRKST
jgi:arylesterase / paraoxonase